MLPAKTPVPVLLLCHTKVRQPLVLPSVAETTWPSSAVPVQLPNTGAAVLLPSYTVMLSTGAAPPVLNCAVMKFTEMAAPGSSGQIVQV